MSNDASLTSAVPLFRVKIAADLKCHLCGRSAGVIESDKFPFPGRVRLRTQGNPELTIVSNWRALRCPTCGGSLFADDVERVYVRREFTARELFGPDTRRRRQRQERPGEPRPDFSD